MDSDDDFIKVLDEISQKDKTIDRGSKGHKRASVPNCSTNMKRVSSFEEIFDEISSGPLPKSASKKESRTLSRLACNVTENFPFSKLSTTEVPSDLKIASVVSHLSKIPIVSNVKVI